jgi:hypothetical protein
MRGNCELWHQFTYAPLSEIRPRVDASAQVKDHACILRPWWHSRLQSTCDTYIEIPP